MYVKCKECTAYVEMQGSSPLKCEVCGAEFKPNWRQRQAFARKAAAARLRAVLQPWDTAASILVFAVTALLTFGMLGYGPAKLVQSAFWLFPAWSAVLVVLCGLTWRLDRSGGLTALRYSTLALLGVLLIPVVWDLTPAAQAVDKTREVLGPMLSSR
ncbi:MAG: hypothetical protein ACK47B_02010 [Armatimonadota bacterium]